jgi:hypothetical protein
VKKYRPSESRTNICAGFESLPLGGPTEEVSHNGKVPYRRLWRYDRLLVVGSASYALGFHGVGPHAAATRRSLATMRHSIAGRSGCRHSTRYRLGQRTRYFTTIT